MVNAQSQKIKKVVTRVCLLWLMALLIQCLVTLTHRLPHQFPEKWSEELFLERAGFAQGIEQFGDVWERTSVMSLTTLLLRPDGMFYIKTTGDTGVEQSTRGQWKHDSNDLYLLQQEERAHWLRYRKQEAKKGCAYLLPVDAAAKKFMRDMGQGQNCPDLAGANPPSIN